MTAPPDPLAALRAAAADRDDRGMRRVLRPRAADDGVLDLASNDYLGLARDPRVTAAAAEAALQWGAGSTGSRLVTGSTRAHHDLEEALAEHCGTEAALVLSSGYLANLAAVTTLAGEGDLVVSEAQNHASLVDACRLSRARTAVSAHADAADVDRLLAAHAGGHAVVVSDSVFSVDGGLAPLGALAGAARRHGALLLVDEAHALGVVGPRGAGACAALGLSGLTDVVLTATLSKALGSQGGVVLGPRVVIDHLVDTARPFIFDTGLAPASVGAAHAALRALQDDPDLPARARDRARGIAAAARDAGWDATEPSAAVTAIPVGAPDLAVAATAACLARGVRVGCFRPPSVPDGVSRLRLTARADLSDTDVARLRDVLADVRREVLA